MGPVLSRRGGRRMAAFGLTVAVVALLLGQSAGTSPSPSPNAAVSTAVASLPRFSITFAANSTAEVTSLVTTDKPYIRSGDSFDLDSGSPSKLPLNVTAINYWASLLRAAYPKAVIYAHTSGLAHLATLAAGVSKNISGVYYDYEPRYEPEFTTNFTQTLAEFANATVIAHTFGLESVGYPFGRPIAVKNWTQYDWDYGKLAKTVDQLVIQTQRYCRGGISKFQNAVSIVLGEYAADGVNGTPIFQITIGNNTTLTPNEVDPLQAYNCTQVLKDEGLRSLYLWWGPSDNAGVVQFLQEIGRHAAP